MSRTDHPPGAARYHFTTLKTWTEILRLSTEWDALLTDSPADTVFLRWDWIDSWAQVLGGHVQPYVVTARDEQERLVGIAPFHVTSYRCLGTLPVKVLRPLGDIDSGAEYPDLITSNQEAETVNEGLIGRLLDDHRAWDLIWLPRVASWTGAADRITQACRDRGLRVRQRPHSFSALHLPDTFDDYRLQLPAKRRRRRWNRRNRIFRDDVRITQCRSKDEIDDYLSALFELHFRRWQRRGQEGSFRRRPFASAFYREFAPRALEQGWLSIQALRQGGVFHAVQIGYRYKGTFHSMQEGFDPDYLPGVGGTLRLAVIEDCIERGLTTYDFLGEHTDHKASWLAEERFGRDILIAHDGPISHLLMASGIWPTGRYLRPIPDRLIP